MARRDPEDDALALVAAAVEHLDREGGEVVLLHEADWAKRLGSHVGVDAVYTGLDAAVAEEWIEPR